MTPLAYDPRQSKLWRSFRLEHPGVERAIARQLRDRPHRTVALWNEHPHRALAFTLIDVISSAHRWPNDHFVPDDPFHLLIPVRSWDALDAEAVVIDIERALHLPEQPDAFWERCLSLTLGDVVHLLAEQMQR